MSKKQAPVATSSTKAEYMAAAVATKEAVWLRNILKGILPSVVPTRPTASYVTEKKPK